MSAVATTTALRRPARSHATAPLGALGTRLGGLAVLAVLLVGCLFASLALGAAEFDVATVIAAFVAFDGSSEHLIVRDLRLPRTLVAVAVGAALALSGTIMQGLTRNPLAEPGLFGVNAGASLAVVGAIAAFGITSPSGYVWFALGGAAAAGVVVYALGTVGGGHGSAATMRLALAGAVLTAFVASITSAILVLDASTLDQFRFWDVGSVSGRDFGELFTVLPFLLAGGLLAVASGRQLNTLSLGDDVARSLGQRVGLTRLVLGIAAVLLAGGAVAAAGPIAFVGLAVPHAARVLVGPDYRWIVGYALLLGPSLLIASDVLGRVLGRPGEIQVGIITALVGGPILVWLVRNRRLANA